MHPKIKVVDEGEGGGLTFSINNYLKNPRDKRCDSIGGVWRYLPRLYIIEERIGRSEQ